VVAGSAVEVELVFVHPSIFLRRTSVSNRESVSGFKIHRHVLRQKNNACASPQGLRGLFLHLISSVAGIWYLVIDLDLKDEAAKPVFSFREERRVQPGVASGKTGRCGSGGLHL
jgi:hypothetical protein